MLSTSTRDACGMDVADPESGESDAFVPHPEERPVFGSVGVRLLPVLGAIAALGMVASIGGRGQAAIVAARSSSVISAAETHRSAACANSGASRLALLENLAGPEACNESCIRTPGCSGFGFQPKDCDGDEAAGGSAGACSLWDGPCHEQEGNCWDQYSIPASLRMSATWSSKASGVGCTNLEEIRLSSESQVSAGACGLSCQHTDECSGFLFQPVASGANGCTAGEQGTCTLLSGRCEEEQDPCWDVYDHLDLLEVSHETDPEIAYIAAEKLHLGSDGSHVSDKDMTALVKEMREGKEKFNLDIEDANGQDMFHLGVHIDRSAIRRLEEFAAQPR